MAADFGYVLEVTKVAQQIEHFGFQFLHARHRDIEKVSCTASWVQHLDLRKPGVKGFNKLLGFQLIPSLKKLYGCRTDAQPICA